MDKSKNKGRFEARADVEALLNSFTERFERAPESREHVNSRFKLVSELGNVTQRQAVDATLSVKLDMLLGRLDSIDAMLSGAEKKEA